ncbi:MAG: ATP-binding protein [Candidatus Adiutricales bacterium]
MKKEKIIIITSALLLVAFVIVIFLYEHYLITEEQKDLDTYAQIVAISLWNFEPQGPTEFLKLVSAHRNYRRLTVSDIDQEKFIDVEGELRGPIGRIFKKIGLIRQTKLNSDIFYENKKIGQISANWYSTAIYIYFYVLIVIMLSITVLWLFLYMHEANRELENRVKARTADLEQTNIKLQKEIQERIKAEESLIKSEEQFRTLADFTYNWESWIGLDGNYLYISPSCERISGYRPEDFKKDPGLMLSMVRPDERSVVTDHFQNELENRGIVSLEFRIITRNNEIRWLSHLCRSVYNEAGTYLGRRVSNRDITDRKEAEIKINEYSRNLERMVEERTSELNATLHVAQEARDRIDVILESVADGLMVTDTDNKIVLINRAAEELLGIRLEEVIDKPINMVIEEKTLREKIMYTFGKMITGYQFDFEVKHDRSGRNRIIQAQTSVIQDRGGKETGIVTSMHDVTHDREIDRMKTEFVSTSAHELRTPLTSIRGFSEILLTRDDLSTEEKKRFLSHINNQAVSLSVIINDLLNISRIESGQGFNLNKAKFNVHDMIHNIIPYFQEMNAKHKIEAVLPEEPVELFADSEKLEQAIENLLGNAIKYSPDGGVIRVVGEIFEDRFQILVEDEGIGMLPEQVEKVFEKFYRADASDSGPEGTGLGMTIVKYIVEAHGGKVWLESEYGKGTSVYITIPFRSGFSPATG